MFKITQITDKNKYNNNQKKRLMKRDLFISRHFTINEFLKNSYGIPNWCSPEDLDNIIELTHSILEPVRKYLCCPIIITSGYRCQLLNKTVGGVVTSQHLTGEAVDFKTANMPLAFEFIRDNLEFDQLIWEKGTKKCPAWIHVSYTTRRKNRKMVIYNY